VDVTLWIELILFIILMGFSGFFSSCETSLFSLSKFQLEQMRRDDNPHIELIERLLSEPRRLIVTILIGNEFVNVAASVISAAVIIELLGAESKFINLFVMIPLLLLVGEITPKTLAIKNNVAFATYQSVPIDRFAWAITPVRTVVRIVADQLITLTLGKARSRGNIITEDMVRTLAHEAVGDGVLHKAEAQYIDQIFEFGSKTIEEVMTPRSNIFFLRKDKPLSEMVSELRRTRHTKVPIYREHRDEVLGILYARDLLGSDLSRAPDDPEWLLNQLREPYFVPETKPVVDLFRTFRKRRLSLALTVDEYGGVTGLVTMEDLLECIFGDLPSASEVAVAEKLRKRLGGTDRIAAAMTIEQFNQDFNSRLPADLADTIGGFILHECGELPPEGSKVTIKGWEFTVVTVDNNRIQEVKAKQLFVKKLEKFNDSAGDDKVKESHNEREISPEKTEVEEAVAKDTEARKIESEAAKKNLCRK
jgi:putative hemolysin